MKEAGEKLISRADEAAALGSMLVDSSCIEDVFAIVSADDFMIPQHQTIFRAVQRLHSNNGESIDGLLLRDELVARGELEKIGGAEYIGEILESVPSAANAEFYAKPVKEKSRRRRLYHAVERMKEIAEGNGPVGECVYEIQQVAAGRRAVARYLEGIRR